MNNRKGKNADKNIDKNIENRTSRDKKNVNSDNMELCQGIRISESIYTVKENRLWTLIFKGIMTYFFTAGGICGLLSASGTKYTPILVNVLLLIISLYVACIHYNKKWENVGNIVFLIAILVFGFGLSLYMNTGFYAVLNDLNEYAKKYFDYTGIRTYAEPINNRLMAVNIAAITIGTLCIFMINMWLKRMMYLDAALLALLMLIYPAYLEREPDLIYVIMVMCAATMGYILKRADHYQKTQDDSVLTIELDKQSKRSLKQKIIDKKNKVRISPNKTVTYRYNIKGYIWVGCQVIIVAFALLMLMQIIIPKKTYHTKNYETPLKSSTKEEVGTFIRQGLFGFLNMYDNVAGMGDGRLGGVGLVNLDYNTDFILRYTPYSDDTIYLRQNYYVDYVPYDNRWLDIYDSIAANDVDNYIKAEDNEADTLKKAYENELKDIEEKTDDSKDAQKQVQKENETKKSQRTANKENEQEENESQRTVNKENEQEGKKSQKTANKETGNNNAQKSIEKEQEENNKNRITAKGKMEIENIGLDTIFFRPYYALDSDIQYENYSGVEKNIITYYPRLDKTDVKVKQAVNLTPYLRYSEENEESIERLVKEAGLREDMKPDKIVSKLAAYFQKEFPYTLNPGNTPIKEDFVNNFVNEYRKGYCVHFATTATLVFRYMGIPARYVEGYAVQFDDILNGTVLQNKKYSDYYDGYSELGETGYIEVEVTDASAHAWVEIYDKEYGWIPVEVTPSSTEEEKSSGGFWNRFMGIFYGDNQQTNQEAGTKGDEKIDSKEDILASDMVRMIVVLLIVAICVFMIVASIKASIRKRRYREADINDKLIWDYSKMLKKLYRKHRLLRDKVNYEQQLYYIHSQKLFAMPVDNNVVDKLVDILQQAGFSQNLISEEDDRFIRDVLGI